MAYKISGEENKEIALSYLEVREKQYDTKAYVDFYTEPNSTIATIQGVMVYVASPDPRINPNYLGPASLEEMAKQIIQAEGPSGPNRDYLFQLDEALKQHGCEDSHVIDLANAVRKLLPETKPSS
ncbi:uncharacterized protein A4U43_C07F37410 [Asparagus officinalis]|uniref:glutathione-specific gamma-glutamylcyclotransferase n=2 Tax=Asparagus officinalis TaxID=4686 RepID=A0A5P1EJW0_ASPOF|nr:uncharacterized protein A4U43_C07F37410 [Asparagus officinalis]